MDIESSTIKSDASTITDYWRKLVAGLILIEFI